MQMGHSMIKQVGGDILLSKARVIAHGVAPNDDHAQGLAHSLREYAPAMYKDFRHYCKTQHPQAGSIWTWAGAGGQQLVALFTQESAYHPGERPGRASLSHVSHALHALRQFIEREKPSSVALPRLATGVGGLAWEEVLPVIHRQLGDAGIPVIVYSTFHAGVAAAEGL
jgi:O-acetyl-ADP-ribose deacetylase (regulator of RNase III)